MKFLLKAAFAPLVVMMSRSGKSFVMGEAAKIFETASAARFWDD